MDKPPEILKSAESEEHLIVYVDRSNKPIYPNGLDAVNPELETFGPSKYNIQKDVDQFLYDKQKNMEMKGHEIYQNLQKSGKLKNCLGIADLLSIQRMDKSLLEKLFAGKTLFAWKSVVRGKNPFNYTPRVPCLTEAGGSFVITWESIDASQGSDDPALLFTEQIMNASK